MELFFFLLRSLFIFTYALLHQDALNVNGPQSNLFSLWFKYLEVKTWSLSITKVFVFRELTLSFAFLILLYKVLPPFHFSPSSFSWLYSLIDWFNLHLLFTIPFLILPFPLWSFEITFEIYLNIALFLILFSLLILSSFSFPIQPFSLTFPSSHLPPLASCSMLLWYSAIPYLDRSQVRVFNQ